jgi:hypothetical protein
MVSLFGTNETREEAHTSMIGEGFVKRNMRRGGNQRNRAKKSRKEIAIDAQLAWCKSQIFRIYSVLVRLNNGLHA